MVHNGACSFIFCGFRNSSRLTRWHHSRIPTQHSKFYLRKFLWWLLFAGFCILLFQIAYPTLDHESSIDNQVLLKRSVFHFSSTSTQNGEVKIKLFYHDFLILPPFESQGNISKEYIFDIFLLFFEIKNRKHLLIITDCGSPKHWLGTNRKINRETDHWSVQVNHTSTFV